ncbi:MAG: hypothetical protein PUC13_04335 [Lachnospiraceae bacterium]|nr:hypothetical protein [Lachnospiraceae bacterium]
MKINSYSIGMESERTYSSYETRKLNISAVRINSNALKSATDEGDTFKNLSWNLKEEDEAAAIRQRRTAPITHVDDREVTRVRNSFIQHLWQMFFGREKADELKEYMGWDETGYESMSSQDSGIYNLTPRPVNMLVISGSFETYFEENQSMSFHTGGYVQCEDGRTIDFGLDVEMTASFTQYYKEEGISAQAMCDPLVLNFEGNVAGLSDMKFKFDLDADGTEDEISTLAGGNGFLALDLNNDGRINDGSELFGTKSGNGFADLSQYDEDGNGFIDENDSVFDRLKIWIKDENGEDVLYNLKEKNVGAIYLGNVNTDFVMRGMEGNVNGALRRSGAFLYEDGSGAGVISHLDIAN